MDPLAPSYPWYTPYQFAGNKPIRFIDMDGLEERDPMDDIGNGGIVLLNVVTWNGNSNITLFGTPQGKAILEKTKTIFNSTFTALNVNLRLEFLVTRDPITNDEFKKRATYRATDSYVLLMNRNSDYQLKQVLKEKGWEGISWDGEAGLAHGRAFEAVIDYGQVLGTQGSGDFASFAHALAYTIEHESGHNKFRCHPDNSTGKTASGYGIPGHVEGTVMSGTYQNNLWKYDDYMIRVLQVMHGTLRREQIPDEIIFDNRDEITEGPDRSQLRANELNRERERGSTLMERALNDVKNIIKENQK